MSLKQQAVSSVFWTALNTFSSQGINFVVSVILARLLLPSEFGLIAMMAVFMGIGSVLINSGMSLSLIRTKDVDDEDFSIVFYFNLVAAFLVYLIVFISSGFIANFYNQLILENLIKVYALTFIIDAFSTVQSTRLTKKLDFKTQMKISIPSLLGSSIVGIAMAYLGFGVWSLVFAAITKSVLSSIQLWYWSKWRPKLVINLVKLKHHWNFGYKLLISGLLENVFSNIYAIIIGKFFSVSQVGFYQRADSLKQLPVVTISTVLSKVTFPLFSKIQDDSEKLKDLYKRMMKLVIYLVAPLLFTMSAIAEPLFRLLFSEKWLPAVPYFQILCLNGILYPIHSYNLSILNVKGRSDLFLKLEIIKKVLIVIVVLISAKFGIYGLLYGSVLLSLISFMINTHYSGKFLNYSTLEQLKDILPYLILGLFVSFTSYSFDQLFLLQNTDLLRVFIAFLIGIFTLVSSSFILKLDAYNEVLLIIFKSKK